MNLTLKLKKFWHSFRMNYFQILYNDCLDQTIKQKLKKKMEFHQKKLNDIMYRQIYHRGH
ncbi:hypothetical protein ACWM35_09860 [Neobacillus sp. K501]